MRERAIRGAKQLSDFTACRRPPQYPKFRRERSVVVGSGAGLGRGAGARVVVGARRVVVEAADVSPVGRGEAVASLVGCGDASGLSGAASAALAGLSAGSGPSAGSSFAAVEGVSAAGLAV